jgi:serine/threonine-protein kinase
MASVYAATHRNSKRFAVKLLHPELSLESDVRTRFLREGYAATQVNHPGAVAVLDDDVTEDGLAFLVMELLEGSSVDALWERCRWKMPVGVVLGIAHQLLDVLAAAHANDIVHRDIKPENLFLTTEGQLKVLDFGIARLKGAAHATVTGTGFVMGTPAFMAPEQALGMSKEIDGQSDLWATGAVLYTLLSGEFVHEGESPQAIVVQCATEPARSLAEVLPGAAREVVQLVDSALAFKKSARWPTAVAMRKGVEAAAYAALGTGVSRGALIKLLSDIPASNPDEASADRLATIARMRAHPPPASSEDDRPTDLRGLEAKATTHAEGDLPSERPPRVGLTTEQPVAGDSAIRPPWLARRKVVWAGAAGAVALGLLATVVVHGRREPSDASTSPSGAAVRPDSEVRPAATASPAAPPAPVTSGASTSPAPPAPSVAPSLPTPVPAAPRPAAPVVHLTPLLTPPTTPLAPAATAAPPSPSSSPLNCTPPFTVDPTTGKKKWKPECL